MLIPVSTLSALALLSGPEVPSISARAEGDIVVTAASLGTLDRDSIPSSTALMGGTTVTASVGNSRSRFGVDTTAPMGSAMYAVEWDATLDPLRVQGVPQGGSVTLTGGQTVITLHTNVATACEVVVRYEASTIARAGHAFAARGRIDVGDDGAFEVDASGVGRVEQRLSRVIDSTGLHVRTVSTGSLTSPRGVGVGLVQMRLEIEVHPVLSLRAQVYLRGCGPTLLVQPTALPSVLVDVEQSPAASFSILVLGFNRTDSPLPCGLCTLATIPLLTFPINRSGPDLEIPVPPGVTGFVNVQSIHWRTLGGCTIVTGEAVEITVL